LILPIDSVSRVARLTVACRLVPQSLTDAFLRFVQRLSDQLQSGALLGGFPIPLRSVQLSEMNEVRDGVRAQNLISKPVELKISFEL